MISIKDRWQIEQKSALETLIKWAGDASTLGKVLGESTMTVINWRNRGRMSARAACKLEQIDGCPLTKEQVRPDVMRWECDKYLEQ